MTVECKGTLRYCKNIPNQLFPLLTTAFFTRSCVAGDLFLGQSRQDVQGGGACRDSTAGLGTGTSVPSLAKSSPSCQKKCSLEGQAHLCR